MTDTPQTLVLGAAQIAAIARAIDTLMPWLARSRYRLLPDGNLEFAEAEPAEAVRHLRAHVEAALPEEIREALGRSSGLGWNVFFGHVVAWWLPLRERVGFLRALVDRASIHRLQLRLHWNEGRTVPTLRLKPGNEALWWGAGLGAVGGFLASRFWRHDSVLALLVLGAGLVAGRLYQRVASHLVCGDQLCRQPLGRREETCPSCGARCQP